MEPIHIAACREQDIPALMDYIARRWLAGHVLSRDRTLLAWQYDPRRVVHGAFGGVTVQLAWQGQAIVGMLGLTGFVLNHDGTESPGVWLSNWHVNHECRGQNVALRLLLSVRDLGYDVIGSVGLNEVSARLLGSDVVGDLPRWIGVFDAEATATLLATSGSAQDNLRSWCNKQLIRIQPAATSGEEVEIVSWSSALAAAWDSFWASHLAPTLVGTKRDASYLQWRYLEHPRFAYEVRVAREPRSGAVVGCTVFRVEQVLGREEKVLRVVEFMANPEAEGSLARAVVQACHRHRVSYADFYCSSARCARGLESVGFVLETRNGDSPTLPTRLCPLEPGSFTMTVALRPPPTLWGRLEDLRRTGRLYFTKSDGDQDRPN